VLRGKQVDRKSPHPGPVLGRGADTGRDISHRGGPTAAAAVLKPMLHDPQHDLGQVEHLPGLRRDHRRANQRAPAAAAPARCVHHPLIRRLDLTQRPPLVPRLPTRRPVGAFPPRPRSRLVIALTRRGLVRVPRVLPQPALQLRDPVNQRHQLLGERRVLLPQPSVLLGEHHDDPAPLGDLRAQLTKLRV